MPENLAAGDEEVSENNKPSLIDQMVKELPFSGHSLLGHGAPDRKTAEQILSEGILGNPNYSLLEMAAPLTNSNKSFIDQTKDIETLAQNWPHKDSKFIVLIAMPDGVRANNMVETVMIEDRERRRIPNRFICGFIDVLKGEYIKNPAFVSQAEPAPGIYQVVKPPIRTDLMPSSQPMVIMSTNEADEVW